MQFKEDSSYRYTKFKVTVKYQIAKGQTIEKPEKTFDELPVALNYIKKVMDEYKKYPELYGGEPVINLEKIKTSSTKYLVINEEK